MSKLQKEVCILINLSDDPEQIRELRHKRNIISHNIRKTQIENHERDLDKRIQEINTIKDSAKMFKAVNTLKRKPFENPYVNDAEAKRVCNPQEIHTEVRNHFKKHFNDINANHVEPFIGPPKPLNVPITITEVKQCVKLMNNNRSPGHDNIQIKLIKYGTEELFSEISKTINKTFSDHTPVEIGKGLLVALQKPGKPKGPVQNLRPIILLPILRKMISVILLQRTKPKVENFLSSSQSAYRPGRSTSDIVWAHRWLLAKVQTVETKIYLDGIDMSAAFDTVDRAILLHIMESFVDEDELRMTRLLLSNTTLEIRMNGNVKTEPFPSNVGSPHGDAFSGCLFTIYFEAALRKLRDELNTNDVIPEHVYCAQYIPPNPEEAIYADDTDFINTSVTRRNKLLSIVSATLNAENLKVNNSKTEHTILARNKNQEQEKWRSTKKLGSLLGDREDIARRKQLAIAAMNDMNAIWIRNIHTGCKLRLQLYNSTVLPVLMYNSSTWGLSKTDEKNIDSFHRQQL